MDSHSSSSNRQSMNCTPAPYGRACVGCSRSKCKCFYRADGSGCERCHRLDKVCEPFPSVRKRRTRKPSSQQSSPVPAQGSIEEKLDDLVSLLRSQAVNKPGQTPPQHQYQHRTVGSTPSSLSTFFGSETVDRSPQDPDIVIDTALSFIDLVRPPHRQSGTEPGFGGELSPIGHDVSLHPIPDTEAQNRLGIFRRAFLVTFPFVHIPESMPASELRRQKPFLWLVIMSLTDLVVARQFEMEETIWRIISCRIMMQHHADIDALLAIICFSYWSHYYKTEKPFMNKLTQLAISIAFDLGLHKDPSLSNPRRGTSSRLSVRQANTAPRSLEERRAFLALFQLSSINWEAYRKVQPLNETAHLKDSIQALQESSENPLDCFLSAQISCQLLRNQVTCPSADVSDDELGSMTLSKGLSNVMLRKLEDIREGVPLELQSMNSARLIFGSTELKLREAYLNGSREKDEVQKFRDLEATMSCVERVLAVFADWGTPDWIGMSVDCFNQVMHCLVVLFKLSTLNEPSWDTREVRRRADILSLLDQYIEMIIQLPALVGMVDAPGPRRGLFFKAADMLKVIKMLMLAEMGPDQPATSAGGLSTANGQNDGGSVLSLESDFQQSFLQNLENEPWISDLYGPSWDFDLDQLTRFE